MLLDTIERLEVIKADIEEFEGLESESLNIVNQKIGLLAIKQYNGNAINN